ncbi:MAG: hypothetical protein Q8P18_29140, partial [Pseudomonadota bacterium]|nr:hypothetical protein [Pseudomonadota bacterium]
EEWPAIREALQAWGHTELIGTTPDCLVPPGPARGAWITTVRRVEPTVGGMGMKVERASAEELAEERWEGINASQSPSSL